MSRLLAENLEFRESNYRLQGEIKSNESRRANENAGEVKALLELKLLEIGNLVAKLEEASTPPKNSSPQIQREARAQKKSPDQRNWKNFCSLSEAMGGQECRLPPIPENKSYPRRTLECV